RPDELIGPGAAYQRGDLYVSARGANGWEAPRHLPAPINSAAAECCARFTGGGARLLFTSERGLVTLGPRWRLGRAGFDSAGGGPTGANECSGALSPDGRELYFSRSVPQSYAYAIVVARFQNGTWTTPEVAPFSGRYRDFDADLYPGGRRLYFVSDRPIDGVR